MMMKVKLKLGKYQHYKGRFYQVVGVASHSETLEELVVYQGLYNSDEFGDQPLFVRPLKMFMEDVVVDGMQVPRFKLVED